MTRLLRYALLLVVPVLLVVTTLWLGVARGPYWVGMNHDPGLQYLLNSLNLATLRPVGHTVHPGTPVQVTGAVIIRLVHVVAAPAGEDVQSHVLANPDLYLGAIRQTQLILNGLALLLLGVVALKAFNGISLALIIQLAPFYPHVNSTFVYGSTQVRPESFLFLGALLMATGLVWYTRRFADLRRDGVRDAADPRRVVLGRAAVGFGLVGGFVMATKVNALPLLVPPLFVLQGVRHRLVYAGGVAGSFLFFTLPILAEYPRMASWFTNLAVSPGVHGQGQGAFIDLATFVPNARTILRIESMFAAALAVGLAVLTIAYLVPRFRRIALDSPYFGSLLGVTAAQIVGLAMVSKHSRGWDTYYLAPMTCLTGLTLALSVVCAAMLVTRRATPEDRAGGAGSSWRDRLLPVAAAVVLVAVTVVVFDLRRTEASQIHANYAQARDQRMEIHAQVDRDYGGHARIQYLATSAPEYALYLSNAEAKLYYSAALDARYHDVYFYDPWRSQFFDWYDEPVPFEEISATYEDRVVFQGPPFAELQASLGAASADFRAPRLPLVEVTPPGEGHVDGNRRETIYVFRPVNSRSN